MSKIYNMNWGDFIICIQNWKNYNDTSKHEPMICHRLPFESPPTCMKPTMEKLFNTLLTIQFMSKTQDLHHTGNVPQNTTAENSHTQFLKISRDPMLNKAAKILKGIISFVHCNTKTFLYVSLCRCCIMCIMCIVISIYINNEEKKDMELPLWT